MLYSGPAFSAEVLGDGIVELKFDLADESVNKLNRVALDDLAAATDAIAKDGSVKGVVLTSGKPVFNSFQPPFTFCAVPPRWRMARMTKSSTELMSPISRRASARSFGRPS